MRLPLRLPVAVAGAFALAGLAGPASAAVHDPIPVTPDTYFTALVNGVAASPVAAHEPVIKVICPGPLSPGEYGHPLAGQTVEVDPATPAGAEPVGFTGSAGTQIDATVAAPTSTLPANPPIVFGSYYAPAEIPTSWNVPCGGAGVFAFVPMPTSPTARSLTVPVAFGDIAA